MWVLASEAAIETNDLVSQLRSRFCNNAEQSFIVGERS